MVTNIVGVLRPKDGPIIKYCSVDERYWKGMNKDAVPPCCVWCPKEMETKEITDYTENINEMMAQ